MFVPSAVMNNNAAFYYIQRKYLFFTRDKATRFTDIWIRNCGSQLGLTPNILQVLSMTGRKRGGRSLDSEIAIYYFNYILHTHVIGPFSFLRKSNLVTIDYLKNMNNCRDGNNSHVITFLKPR